MKHNSYSVYADMKHISYKFMQTLNTTVTGISYGV